MIKAIITDIEGTTSSLAFVKDVLFPYARANLADYVRSNSGQESVKKIMAATCQEIGTELDTEQVISQLIQWIDEDKKVTPLKSLQGLIWEAGYQQGDFKGHIYPDAVENLKKWKAKGLDLYVYSSGSVQAQKLLFAYTDYGDLTPLFSGYFDTHIGGKKEPQSYRNIANCKVKSIHYRLLKATLVTMDLTFKLHSPRKKQKNSTTNEQESTPVYKCH
jgi:enolase-phosphatase E1